MTVVRGMSAYRLRRTIMINHASWLSLGWYRRIKLGSRSARK